MKEWKIGEKRDEFKLYFYKFLFLKRLKQNFVYVTSDQRRDALSEFPFAFTKRESAPHVVVKSIN